MPSYAVASESVSLNIMNFGEIRDIAPGQAIFIDRDRNVHVKQLARQPHSPCLFEWVYFARPDSFIDEVNVYRVRINLGRAPGRGNPQARARRSTSSSPSPIRPATRPSRSPGSST